MKKNSARKGAYKLVDKICGMRKEIEQAIYEARMDPRGNNPGGNSGGQFISDPTANRAMVACTPVPMVTVNGITITMPEKWLAVIDHVYEQCGDIERQIFDKRWKEHASADKASMDLYVDRATYYNIVNGIKSYVVELGCQMGLICVIAPENKLKI